MALVLTQFRDCDLCEALAPAARVYGGVSQLMRLLLREALNLGVSRRKLDEVLGEEGSGCVNGGGPGQNATKALRSNGHRSRACLTLCFG
jgi:hypothetical protein